MKRIAIATILLIFVAAAYADGSVAGVNTPTMTPTDTPVIS